MVILNQSLKKPGSWRRGSARVLRPPCSSCGLLWQSTSLLGGGAAVLCLVLRQLGGGTAAQEPNTNSPRFPNSIRRMIAGQRRTPRVLDGLQPKPRHSAPTRLSTSCWPRGATHCFCGRKRNSISRNCKSCGAIRQLDESMALVPAGRVLLGQLAEQSHSACGPTDTDPKLIERNLVGVEPVYLDRFCVTNEEYQRFVDAGGYEQLEFWHEEALPALLDFVDQTGAPGPRYWGDGQYPGNEGRLPVVGISWYEAWAYARWVGKRLADRCRVDESRCLARRIGARRIAQRRYPWGESFDVRRAQLVRLRTEWARRRRRIPGRHQRRRHPPVDRQRVGMDGHAARRIERLDAACF